MNDVTTAAAPEVETVSFHFRKVKDDTGIESKRPTVDLKLPKIGIDDIVAILENASSKPREFELLQEAISEKIQAHARSLLNDDASLTSDNFPYDKITWEAIANVPAKERRGGGIAKEVWEEFAKDYISAMPALTGKTVEQVTNAAKQYLNKFNAAKTNKPVLNILKQQLGIYLTGSPRAEDFAECVEFLQNKADNLLSVDDAALLGNL